MNASSRNEFVSAISSNAAASTPTISTPSIVQVYLERATSKE